MRPEEIRAARADDPKKRDRDFADVHGLREAELVAAFCGQGITRIAAHPDTVIPAARALGEVMALTRNPACVHEKVGRFANYQSSGQVAMVVGEIDLRIYPAHWQHGFLVEREERKSIQIFDAAGDAVHKIHLRESSDLGAWDRLKTELALDDQSDTLSVAARAPIEAPLSRPEHVAALREAWAGLQDTLQFLPMVAKTGMNRLGAIRIAGEPFARPVAPEAVDQVLEAVRDQNFGFMIFVGNPGCIQIHSGPIATLRPMGPWQNVMDPRFNLHLRRDKIADLWVVMKPTTRGPAYSLEAYDAAGTLIFQMFGMRHAENDTREEWRDVLEGLRSQP